MEVDDSDAHVVLKCARTPKDPSVTADNLQGLPEKPEQVKISHSDNVADNVAKNVRIGLKDPGAEQCNHGSETDTAISRGRAGLVNRELVAWMPDPDDSADASKFDLGEHEPDWDQFSANESKFGYTSTWDEDFYTVRLDKAKCGIDEETAARIAREIERDYPKLAEERGQAVHGIDEQTAARIAHEIERHYTSVPHLAEDRGQAADGWGSDEEEMPQDDLARLLQAAHHPTHPAQQQNSTCAGVPAAGSAQ